MQGQPFRGTKTDIECLCHVLEYLKRLYPLKTLSLKDINYKAVMLVALLIGQRCRILYIVTFEINKLLKTSKLGKQFGCLQFKI